MTKLTLLKSCTAVPPLPTLSPVRIPHFTDLKLAEKRKKCTTKVFTTEKAQQRRSAIFEKVSQLA